MPKVDVYKTDGTVSGQIELSEEIFGCEVNMPAIHTVVVAMLANARQGTQSALTRSEVRGGGIKPWRQKGTGRARQGSIRSPQWTKGGVVFAPKPRSYNKKVNKQVKRLAMFSALSDKVNENALFVMEDLNIEAKTKAMLAMLKNIKAEGKVLVVTDTVSENVKRSAANLGNVKTAPGCSLNVYDIVNADNLVILKEAVKNIEEVYTI